MARKAEPRIARSGANSTARDPRSAVALLAELAPRVPLATYLAAARAVRSARGRRFRQLFLAALPDGRVEYAELSLRLARSPAENAVDDALEDAGWGYAGSAEPHGVGVGSWVIEPG